MIKSFVRNCVQACEVLPRRHSKSAKDALNDCDEPCSALTRCERENKENGVMKGGWGLGWMGWGGRVEGRMANGQGQE